MTLTCYNKEIRKVKRSSGRDYCQGMKGVPDTAKLMRIMANQSPIRVESIMIPDGRYGQYANKTIRQIRRVHFPGSALEDMTSEGQRQPNLTALLLTGRNRDCLEG
jgi:protein subunit release factor A